MTQDDREIISRADLIKLAKSKDPVVITGLMMSPMPAVSLMGELGQALVTVEEIQARMDRAKEQLGDDYKDDKHESMYAVLEQTMLQTTTAFHTSVDAAFESLRIDRECLCKNCARRRTLRAMREFGIVIIG